MFLSVTVPQLPVVLEFLTISLPEEICFGLPPLIKSLPVHVQFISYTDLTYVGFLDSGFTTTAQKMPRIIIFNTMGGFIYFSD